MPIVVQYGPSAYATGMGAFLAGRDQQRRANQIQQAQQTVQLGQSIGGGITEAGRGISSNIRTKALMDQRDRLAEDRNSTLLERTRLEQGLVEDRRMNELATKAQLDTLKQDQAVQSLPPLLRNQFYDNYMRMMEIQNTKEYDDMEKRQFLWPLEQENANILKEVKPPPGVETFFEEGGPNQRVVPRFDQGLVYVKQPDGKIDIRAMKMPYGADFGDLSTEIESEYSTIQQEYSDQAKQLEKMRKSIPRVQGFAGMEDTGPVAPAPTLTPSAMRAEAERRVIARKQHQMALQNRLVRGLSTQPHGEQLRSEQRAEDARTGLQAVQDARQQRAMQSSQATPGISEQDKVQAQTDIQESSMNVQTMVKDKGLPPNPQKWDAVTLGLAKQQAERFEKAFIMAYPTDAELLKLPEEARWQLAQQLKFMHEIKNAQYLQVEP